MSNNTIEIITKQVEDNRKRSRRYYYRHLEEERARGKIKNEERKESGYYSEYYLTIAEQKREYSRKYRKEHLEEIRSKEKLQRERRKVDCNKYYSRKIGNIVNFSYKDWLYCLKYFNNQCAVCGRDKDELTVISMDHWIPVSKGGSTTPQNIIPLCHSKRNGTGGCNQSKNNCDGYEWLMRRYGQESADVIINRIQQYFKSLDIT